MLWSAYAANRWKISKTAIEASVPQPLYQQSPITPGVLFPIRLELEKRNIPNHLESARKRVYYLKFVAYHHKILIPVLDRFHDLIIRCMDIRVSGIIPLPTKIRKYTVLKSPVIDKKSREQFEMRTHSRLMVVQSDSDTMKRFIKFFINEEMGTEPGVALKVTEHSYHYPTDHHTLMLGLNKERVNYYDQINTEAKFKKTDRKERKKLDIMHEKLIEGVTLERERRKKLHILPTLLEEKKVFTATQDDIDEYFDITRDMGYDDFQDNKIEQLKDEKHIETLLTKDDPTEKKFYAKFKEHEDAVRKQLDNIQKAMGYDDDQLRPDDNLTKEVNEKVDEELSKTRDQYFDDIADLDLTDSDLKEE